MRQSVFVHPLDVLHLRGNRLFADAGHSIAQMPPWPSLFAGALRSRILVDRGISFEDFLDGRVADAIVKETIGASPKHPGRFRVAGVRLARSHAGGVDQYLPAPADLQMFRGPAGGALEASYLAPVDLGANDVAGSSLLPLVPALPRRERAKPEGGIWLRGDVWQAYLAGKTVDTSGLLRSTDLWDLDPRLGIALESKQRTASKSLLYTSDTVALSPGVGFAVDVDGVADLLPSDGLIRLGGDGRGASLAALAAHPWPQSVELQGLTSFRLILTTPAYFRGGGWLPDGVTRTADGEHILSLDGGACEARLAAAVIPRFEVVSGWDLATGQPKSAERVVPAGSVYWFDRVQGRHDALRRRLEHGWWGDDLSGDAARRRAEGFNNVAIGRWPQG